jgi:hypothetical protein
MAHAPLLALALLAQGPRESVPPPEAAPMRPPSLQPAPLDEARLEELIDRAVERALARRRPAEAYAAAPAAYAAPQAAVQAAYTARPALASPHPTIRVLAPPGPHRRALAALGRRLVECGQPRLVTFELAPAVAPAAPRAVYAAPQAP